MGNCGSRARRPAEPVSVEEFCEATSDTDVEVGENTYLTWSLALPAVEIVDKKLLFSAMNSSADLTPDLTPADVVRSLPLLAPPTSSDVLLKCAAAGRDRRLLARLLEGDGSGRRVAA